MSLLLIIIKVDTLKSTDNIKKFSQAHRSYRGWFTSKDKNELIKCLILGHCHIYKEKLS